MTDILEEIAKFHDNVAIEFKKHEKTEDAEFHEFSAAYIRFIANTIDRTANALDKISNVLKSDPFDGLPTEIKKASDFPKKRTKKVTKSELN